MIVSIKVTTEVKGREPLTALVRDLQELERFDGASFNFSLNSAGAPAPIFSQFVRARPLHDIVREVLVRSDAAMSSWYRAAPRGQPHPPRVRAGTQALRAQRRELALALLREGGPKILTSKASLQAHYKDEIKTQFGGPISSQVLGKNL